jgi:hypothetical protein
MITREAEATSIAQLIPSLAINANRAARELTDAVVRGAQLGLSVDDLAVLCGEPRSKVAVLVADRLHRSPT